MGSGYSKASAGSTTNFDRGIKNGESAYQYNLRMSKTEPDEIRRKKAENYVQRIREEMDNRITQQVATEYADAVKYNDIASLQKSAYWVGRVKEDINKVATKYYDTSDFTKDQETKIYKAVIKRLKPKK